MENSLATKEDIKHLEVKIDAIETNLRWLVTLLGIIGTILAVCVALPNIINVIHSIH